MFTTIDPPARKRLRTPLGSRPTTEQQREEHPHQQEEENIAIATTTAAKHGTNSALLSHKQTMDSQRLRNQMKQLANNDKRHRQMLVEVKAQYESALDLLRSEHEGMLARLEGMQEMLDEDSGSDANMVSVDVLESRSRMYERRIELLEKENGRLKEEMVVRLKDKADVSRSKVREDEKEEEEGGVPIGALSVAPPDVMRELTRVRVKLSQEERNCRMLKRQVNELQPKAQKFISSREVAKRTQEKVDVLEKQVRSLQQENQIIRAKSQQWMDWKKSLDKNFSFLNNKFVAEDVEMEGQMDMAGPPSIFAIFRHVERLEKRCSESETKCEEFKKLWLSSKETTKVLSERRHSEKKALEEKISSLTEKLLKAETESATAKNMNKIMEGERQSLRELLETYEKIEIKSKGGVDQVNIESPTIAGLRLSLASMTKQNQTLKHELDTLRKKLEASESKDSIAKEEYDRVVDKFGKIKEALLKERDKASLAEERALKAETIAGKGSFNESTTHILHLKQNPLTEAIHEKYQIQIKSLKAQLNDLSEAGSGKGRSIQKLSDVDAQKLHKRLKESFKEQIGLFREGVYLLTGYKIEMLQTSGEHSERPQFKVRSMYAEREDDYLMFMWPKIKNNETVEMLDLMNTEFAQSLSNTDEFQYLSKFKSTPGLLASLTMKLIEQQTFA